MAKLGVGFQNLGFPFFFEVPNGFGESCSCTFKKNDEQKSLYSYTWIFLLCVKFLPKFTKNTLPILAEVLHHLKKSRLYGDDILPSYMGIIYTWNPNDPCFDWKRPSFGGLKPQNRGQTGSRYFINHDIRIPS